VTGGSVKVDVKFGIFTVFDKTLALCDLAKQAGMTCPISAGAQTVKVTENVPDVPLSVSMYFIYKLYSPPSSLRLRKGPVKL